MKHIFIMNPAAGRGRGEELLPQILRAAKGLGVDYEIHRTVNAGEGENHVRSLCFSHKQGEENRPLRFYAVGGDGTLAEVVNGACGFTGVEVGCVPVGSGNDFVRNFENMEAFLDMERQMAGKAFPVDLLRCNGRYVINMINIGLDCAAAETAQRLKGKMGLAGTLAYLGGVADAFTKNQTTILALETQKGMEFSGEYTLLAIGNGKYCGGGFKGVPKARPNDGLMDISLIQKISRRTFLSLVNRYRKGTHLESKRAGDLVTYIQCRKAWIRPQAGNLKFCIDGEVGESGTLEISVAPEVIQFCLPSGVIWDEA